MAEMLIQSESLTAIADEVRELSGSSESMGLNDIKNNLSEVNANIAVQSDLITQIKIIVDEKTDLHLPTLTNEGTADDLLLGKELINSKGEKVVGTIPTRDVDDITVDGEIITIPEGYYAEPTEKSVALASQATPSISVDSSGLITAIVSQSTGYVSGGIKTSTHQLAFQPARTITPSTVSQVAVSSGYFTGGDVIVEAVPTQSKNVTPASVVQTVSPDTGKFLSQVTVVGDSSLKPENIKKGVSVFNTIGTFRGGKSTWSENEDAIIGRTIKTYTNSRVSFIGVYAFSRCHALTTANFPAVTTIANVAFYHCDSLTSVSFPAATKITSSAFMYCTALTSVSFPAATNIYSNAFAYCSKLSQLYLMGSILCSLSTSQAFYKTGITSTAGTIYVPASLLDSYKAATNWAYFSNRFVGV